MFFFNDTATTEIYTLSLHDALPISRFAAPVEPGRVQQVVRDGQHVLAHQEDTEGTRPGRDDQPPRSEEHTSELQSRQYLVCRLLLEKKKSHATNTKTLQQQPKHTTA